MKLIEIKTINIPTLELGYLGENEVIQVNIDYDDWVATYGNGTLSLLFKRPNDTAAYPITLDQDENMATWIVTNTELSQTGQALAQLVYVVNEQVKKSAIFAVNIRNSLDGSGTPPDPFQSWIDEVNASRGIAESALETATQAVDTATSALDELVEIQAGVITDISDGIIYIGSIERS